MTLEQIVNTHPCPIIRGKIMENVTERNYLEIDNNTTLKAVVFHCIKTWSISKEGSKFWKSVYMDNTLIYDQIKHLDNSYVPEPAKPLPVWRKIDKDKLCIEIVAAMHINEPKNIFTGTLELDDYDIVTIEISKGAWVSGFSHYIPLSDLINLPIED